MNTLEGNKLIAVFRGGIISNTGVVLFPDGTNISIHQLKYHTSWDWLMPVGIKCLEIGSTYQNYPFITEDIQNAASRFEMQQLYKAVLEFIQWYNTQNKQP